MCRSASPVARLRPVYPEGARSAAGVLLRVLCAGVSDGCVIGKAPCRRWFRLVLPGFAWFCPVALARVCVLSAESLHYTGLARKAIARTALWPDWPDWPDSPYGP